MVAREDSSSPPPAASAGGAASTRKSARRGVLRVLPWVPALLWMAVIFRLSSVPGSNVPGKYGNLAHFVEYGVLAGLLLLAALRELPIRRAASVVVVAASLYGVTDEFHQAFVPGRVPDPADWAIDTLGAATAVLVLGLLATKVKAAREEGGLRRRG